MDERYITLRIRVPRPSRRWLQISLRTLIVLMLVCGAWLGMWIREIDRRRSAVPLYQKAYYVGDVLGYRIGDQSTQQNIQLDFAALKAAITANTSPDVWGDADGRGRIREFEANLTLVISQSQEVHEEVAGYLNTLRAAARKHPQHSSNSNAQSQTGD